jgi:N-hydroxyarylamine O-acetyltransferase
MNVDTYLRRIGHDGPTAPSAQTLRALQRAHLFHVPFENLDIMLGRRIDIDLQSFYEKVVVRRRGGFCYELNGLFGWLLGELGFDVTFLSGRVVHDGVPGPEFDHMVLMVRLEERWLADVGFGDTFVDPLRLDEADEQPQRGRLYRIDRSGPELTLMRREPDADWEAQYIFTLTPRSLPEYRETCLYQQISPDSFFTKKRVCSLATETGRITLRDTRLIVTGEGSRRVTAVGGEAEFDRILRDVFGIVVDPPPPEGWNRT